MDNNKEKTIDISILYSTGTLSESTKIECDFYTLMNSISSAKKKNVFFQLSGFAINPHYIVSVKELK
ncbi:MAG: hypothetical protein ACTSQE_16270 [Candidatus Heimdallarchaeaceae archaeon]